MKYNRIRITGGSGSGKSYLCKKIAKLLKVEPTFIDEIVYDFSDTVRFDNKRLISERNKLFEEALKKPKWVMDGGYWSWGRKGYDIADLIIFLKVPLSKRLLNTIKRYFFRIKSGNHEGFRNFLKLCWYNLTSRNKWDKRREHEITKAYPKTQVFTSADEAFEWIRIFFNKSL